MNLRARLVTGLVGAAVGAGAGTWMGFRMKLVGTNFTRLIVICAILGFVLGFVFKITL